jgi:hypothetical protein
MIWNGELTSSRHGSRNNELSGYELQPRGLEMKQDQILSHYRERLHRAMQGMEPMADVCGLAIEDLRASIIAERDELLRKHGYVIPGRESCSGTQVRR